MKCPNCGYDSNELTPSELRVEKILMEKPRMGMREIAHELSVTPRTVEAHKTAVFRKRGVHSRVELLHQAILAGRFPVTNGEAA
jgi:DNA-binding CsgD family transcriptional regulator